MYSLSAEHCFILRNNAISDERVRDRALSAPERTWTRIVCSGHYKRALRGDFWGPEPPGRYDRYSSIEHAPALHGTEMPRVRTCAGKWLSISSGIPGQSMSRYSWSYHKEKVPVEENVNIRATCTWVWLFHLVFFHQLTNKNIQGIAIDAFGYRTKKGGKHCHVMHDDATWHDVRTVRKHQ